MHNMHKKNCREDWHFNQRQIVCGCTHMCQNKNVQKTWLNYVELYYIYVSPNSLDKMCRTSDTILMNQDCPRLIHWKISPYFYQQRYQKITWILTKKFNLDEKKNYKIRKTYKQKAHNRPIHLIRNQCLLTILYMQECSRTNFVK